MSAVSSFLVGSSKSIETGDRGGPGWICSNPLLLKQIFLNIHAAPLKQLHNSQCLFSGNSPA